MLLRVIIPFKFIGEFPSASEKVTVKAGGAAPYLKIRVGLTNADRRFCSRAKTAGNFKAASKRVLARCQVFQVIAPTVLIRRAHGFVLARVRRMHCKLRVIPLRLDDHGMNAGRRRGFRCRRTDQGQDEIDVVASGRRDVGGCEADRLNRRLHPYRRVVGRFDGPNTPPLRGSRRSRAGPLSMSKGRRIVEGQATADALGRVDPERSM